MSDPLEQEACADSCCWFDRRQLRTLLESDSSELLCELYTLYLGQIREMSSQLASILPPYDFESIEQLAHKMKSSSHSIGAVRVAKLLNEAESAALECNDLQMQNILETLMQDCIKTIEELEREILALRNES